MRLAPLRTLRHRQETIVLLFPMSAFRRSRCQRLVVRHDAAPRPAVASLNFGGCPLLYSGLVNGS